MNNDAKWQQKEFEIKTYGVLSNLLMVYGFVIRISLCLNVDNK